MSHHTVSLRFSLFEGFDTKMQLQLLHESQTADQNEHATVLNTI